MVETYIIEMQNVSYEPCWKISNLYLPEAGQKEGVLRPTTENWENGVVHAKTAALKKNEVKRAFWLWKSPQK